ncbi:LTA synthase family protein [Chungangia koreensis]|uniref:LTA synthase family protein n=1 Tax=Chungangia koreensis TaxID=752657 RepID=A0ABV8X7J2_9LACT
MKKINKWPNHSVLLIAIIATWIKTYVVYKTSFNIKIENGMQEFILFLNPLAFILFAYGISLYFKSEKGRNRYLITISSIMAFVLYANVVFYRFFNDFITLPVLFQTTNFGDLGSSVFESIYIYDILYFIDIAIIVAAIKWLPNAVQSVSKSLFRRLYFVSVIAVLFMNLGLAEAERPQLLTRIFDREMLVKNLGMYNYHLFDVYVQSKSHAQRVLADGSELVEVNNYIRANQAEPNPELYGMAEGRNLIMISLESLQSFVINNEMNGEVITPFLNELTKDPNTYYFSNFYHQTGLGKTSDSEFILENSLYPLNGAAVFTTNSGNTFNGMAQRLSDKGYYTNVLHANNKSFWNRDMMYPKLGYDKYYDQDSFVVEEGEAVNWGMKDIPFMEQSVDLMQEMPQPFYSRMITLTNHYPFTLDEEDKMIQEYDSNSGTLNRYFQTVRYMDEAVKVFFEDLKESGLYENSIIVMYGDHYGISENHNDAMSRYMGKEITPFESAQLQRVPLFIHIPGYEGGKVIDEVSGQLDLRPTILHMLGIKTDRDMQFGADIFSEEHEEFVVFRDGGFVTDEVVYTKNTCYDKATGIEIDGAACEKDTERAQKELKYSDQIINGDLLRFYDNKTGNLIKPDSE